MRIGIRFSDNDYINTLRPFMDFLMKSIRESPELKENLTKDRIVDIFNQMAYPIYLLCQNMWRPTRPQSDADKIRTKNWIKIKTENVYLEDEIDERIRVNGNWENYEFFYIDTDNNQSDCW